MYLGRCGLPVVLILLHEDEAAVPGAVGFIQTAGELLDKFGIQWMINLQSEQQSE